LKQQLIMIQLCTLKLKHINGFFDAIHLISFHPEILYFRMLKLMVFFPETRSFFLLARKSSNYEEAYLNTLTNNCAD